MHVLPRVRELEERLGEVLSVVGVHAGKFSTERRTERIAAACDRLGVEHAVVNDRQFRIWKQYGVRAWPTIALVDPQGRLLRVESGEFEVASLAELIENVAADARMQGTLREGPDPALGHALARHEGTLRFPSRAIAHEHRLLVSDTGHGRVMECSFSADEARAQVRAVWEGFGEPQGIALLDDVPYVADRTGHSVWRLEPGGDRTRVAGTGALGAGMLSPGPALEIDLRSPWGLAPFRDGLALTMAGAHQIWYFHPGSDALSQLAGRFGEDLVDGPALASLLAQPTGIDVDDGVLAFADCESSAIRVLESDGRRGDSVRTIVGTGLFDFGDRDGTGDRVLLQHDQDVAWHEGVIAVADTYNDRLKSVDPETRASQPWRGEAGESGALREPGGVSSLGTRLLVADTGHHRVVLVEPDGRLQEVGFS